MRHGRHYINFTLRGPAIGAKLGVFQVPQPPDNQSDCSICLASMDGSEPLFEMPCGHVFHERCISTWLQQKSECAMCRQAAPPGCSRLPKSHTPQGWMLSGLGGSLVHAGEFSEWDGQPYRNELKEGDVVGMLLDLDAATLTVWVNGERRGVMARPGMTSLSGKPVARLEGPLCWAVDLLDTKFVSLYMDCSGYSSVEVERLLEPVPLLGAPVSSLGNSEPTDSAAAEAAAAKLQAAWRDYAARKAIEQAAAAAAAVATAAAAAKIQGAWRGYSVRKTFEELSHNHYHQLWAKECDAGDAPIGAPAHTPADSGLWCPPLPEVDSEDLPPPGEGLWFTSTTLSTTLGTMVMAGREGLAPEEAEAQLQAAHAGEQHSSDEEVDYPTDDEEAEDDADVLLAERCGTKRQRNKAAAERAQEEREMDEERRVFG